MDVALVVVGWVVGLIVAIQVWRWLSVRQLARARAFESTEATFEAAEEPGALSGWLFRAGLRGPNAVPAFVFFTILGACVGGGITASVLSSGVVADSARALERLPGGVGELFLPLVYLAPWVPLLGCPALPWLYVRMLRRRRVALIEEDLPLALDLLATLAEAGLGLDAGLARVLAALEPSRPLPQELRAFQADLLAGRGRVVSLRRLGWRVDVLTFSIFISALVQAEQAGAGVSDVLRRQAEDLRHRRREEASAFAASLPVKLLFPLIICFLPGLFVATLGPTFYQFFQAADAVIRTRRLP